MESTAASMAIRIDADVSSAVSGLKRVDKQLNALVPGGQAVSNVLQRVQFGLLQIVQGAARNTFVNIISGMKGMVNSGVKVAETLESASVGFETILKSGENVNALLLDIQQNAVKTPFDVDALTLSTQKLALITKNGKSAENTVLDLGKALAAAGRGTAELNRMATNLQQVGTNALITERDIREFGNAGIDITDIVLRFSDAFKQSNEEMTAASAKEWLKNISNPYEVLTEALHNAGESVDGFAGIYEKGATTIKQANENMSDAISIFSYRVLEQANVLDKVKNIFSEFQNELFLDETFTANTIEAIRHVVDMINELDIVRPIIEGIKKAVSAFASGQFDNVIVFFRELFNAIKQFSGIQVIVNAFKVLLDLFSDNHTSEEVGRVANQLGTFIRYLLELKFVLSVSTYLANFLGVIMKLGLTLYEIVTPIMRAVSGMKLLSASTIKFVAVAALIVGAVVLIQKYGDKIGEVFQNIGQALADFGSMIGNAVNEFVSFGYNIMAGLWNGLVEGAKAVIEEVKKIARAIINTFKSIFRIASPSKVMRDEIGRYVDEGIAEGITAYYGTVIDAAEDVLEKLVELQDEYVQELSDFGALDLVQQVNVYKNFAQLYRQGTKARLEMDSKVHDAETSIVKEMISLIEDYNKEYDRAYKKAKDYYDMFDYTQNVLTRTTRSVIEGLTRQNDNLTKYYNNLAKMSKMGFDSDFMEYIYEQGLDAASEVAGLADATAEQIEEINNLWATRGKVAADIAVLNTKELKEETLEELDYLQSGLDTKVLNYYDSGYHLGYEFSRGIYDMLPTIQDALQQISTSTSKSGSSASDAMEAAVGGINDALAGVDPSEFEADLGRIDVQAFDTADALSLLKNMLSGIPWQIWVAGITVVGLKMASMFRDWQRDVPKAVQSLGGGMNKLIENLQVGVDRMVDAINKMSSTIEGKIGKVSQATYNSAREISNYESVYRQAMDGVLSVTDKDVKGIIEAIDFAKSQGIVTTQEATSMIGDIMRNGVEDITSDTRQHLDKIEDELNMTISTSSHIIEDGLEKIDYTARDIYDQTLYDFTHSTQDTASDIEHILDSTLKQSSNMITSKSKDMADGIVINFSDAAKKATSSMKDLPLFFEHEVGDSIAETMQDIIDETELTADKVDAAFGKASKHTITYIDNVDRQMTSTDRVVSHSMSTMTHLSDVTSKASMSANKLGNTLNVLAGATAGVAPEISQGLTMAAEAVDKGARVIDNDAVRTTTSIFDKIKAKIKSGSAQTAKATQESIVSTGKVATDGVKTVGKDLKTEVSTVGDGVLEKTGGIRNKVLNKIATFVADVGQTLSSVVSSVIKIITDIIGNIVDYIMQIVEKIASGIGKAIAALLRPLSDPTLLIGVVALAGVAATLVILAKACQEFAEVRWQDIIKAGAALGIMTAIMGIIGMFWEYIAIGAAIVAAVSVVIAMFGWGIKTLAQCIKEASDYGAQTSLQAIGKIIAALGILGAGLTLTMVSNILGTFSGLFAMALAGEVSEVAKALANASEIASRIKVSNLKNVVEAVATLGNKMIEGFISNLLGSFSGAFATVVAGEVLSITENLAKASKYAKNIKPEDVKKIQTAIGIINEIDFGWFFSNLGKAASSAEMASVVYNLTIIVKGVREICDTLKMIDQSDENTVVQQVGTVKSIVGTIAEMFDGNWIKAIGQNWQSSQLEGVVTSVDKMMDSVLSMLEKLRRIDKVSKGETIQQVGKIKEIMGIVQELLSGNFFLAIGQNWQSGNLSAMSENLKKILDSIIDMCKSLKEIKSQVPESGTIFSVLAEIQLIIQNIDQVFSGDWMAAIGDNWQSDNLRAASANLEEILNHVKNMFDKVATFDRGDQYTCKSLTAPISDIEEIVQALADINITSKDFNGSLDNMSNKTNKLMTMSSNLDTILGTIQSMSNKLSEFRAQSMSPDDVQKMVNDVADIVKKIAGVSFEQSEGDLSSLANKSESLKTASSNLDSILGTVQTMVDKMVKLHTDGYNVGEGGDKDVTSLVEQVEKIVQTIAKMEITEGGDYLKELSEKSGHIKTMAESLNGIIEQITKMVDNLKAFTAAYADTTVEKEVQKINDEILYPLLGGEGYTGIDIPYTDISQDDVDKLGFVKSALEKIGEIATTLKSVPDVAAEILNVEAILKFIDESMAKLPDQISKYKGDMSNQGMGLANEFINGWKSALGDATTAARDMQSAIWNEIQNHMTDENQQGVALAQELINGLRSKSSEFSTVGHEFQDTFWQAIQARMNDEYQQGVALANQVVDGINSVTPKFQQAGANAQGQFWAGIQNKFPDEYRQGQALSGQVIDGIWSKQGDWWWTGDNIVAGVAGGIWRNMWQINRAAGQISQTAINKLKELLDIASPSKVMAEIGGYVAEGFADGIIDNLSEVENAGEALAEAVMDGYNDTIEPINLTAFEARGMATTEGATFGGTFGKSTSVVQNNNIYNGMDMASALSDIAWAVSRS